MRYSLTAPPGALHPPLGLRCMGSRLHSPASQALWLPVVSSRDREIGGEQAWSMYFPGSFPPGRLAVTVCSSPPVTTHGSLTSLSLPLHLQVLVHSLPLPLCPELPCHCFLPCLLASLDLRHILIHSKCSPITFFACAIIFLVGVGELPETHQLLFLFMPEYLKANHHASPTMLPHSAAQ